MRRPAGLGLVLAIVVLAAIAVVVARAEHTTPVVPAPSTAGTGEPKKLIGWVQKAPIRAPRSLDSYDREDWPHWRDADDYGWNSAPNDYCDAREAALARDGRQVRADPDTCDITAGTWTVPYTGATITDPAEIDIDHVVPLAAAHRAGADRWDEQRRIDYANSPGVVLAVSAEANRAKGDQEPDQWRPASRASWCAYGSRWAMIKHRWDLAYISKAEKTATLKLLGTC